MHASRRIGALLGSALLLVALTTSAVVAADDADAPPQADPVRGLEREGRDAPRPWRPVLRAAFAVPRYALDGALLGTEHAVGTLADPAFQQRLHDLFWIVDDRLAWYPRLTLASGITPLVGASLLWRGDAAEADVYAAVHSDQTYDVGGEATRRWHRGGTVWSLGLAGTVHGDDDLVFYGIGARPGRDPRSALLADADDDHGTYRQRRRHLRLTLGAAPRAAWQAQLITLVETRRVRDLSERGDALGASCDRHRRAGGRGETRRWQSEVDLTYDSRVRVAGQDPDALAGGLRASTYAGTSLGLDDDPSDLWLGGVDAALFVPVLGPGRLLAARLVLDGITRRDDTVPIAFTEYPRHPAFRGVSTRTLLRSDETSLVSSLEYLWPVTPFLGGHLFFDHLMVARDPGGLAPTDGLWAAGVGLDLLSEPGTVGGVLLAAGSQGFRFLLTAGFSGDSADRFDQR